MVRKNQITTFFKKHPELKLKQKIIAQLINKAKLARKKAYTPYSHYNVGAAVLCKSGKIYGGCNVENASYTLTAHAEQVAILQAIVAGEAKKERKFIKALVVVHEGDTMPCGICRQGIQEFCDEALIINASPKKEILGISCLSKLLPATFSPSHLGME